MRPLPTFSLRTALAVVMAGLAAAAVLLSVGIAGREVRRLNTVAAGERLEMVAERLEALLSGTAEQRRELLVAAGRDSLLVAALRGEPVDPDDLDERLDQLRSGTDAGLPIELWDRQGNVVFSDVPVPPTDRVTSPASVLLDTVPAYGAFIPGDGVMLYHSTAPVSDGTAILGWVVQVRRLGSPAAARQIQALVGQDARVFFYYEGDSIWVSLEGEAVAPPLQLLPEDSMQVRTADGDRTLMRARRVEGLPWVIVVEMSDAVISDGDAGFMARMLGAGLLLILAGAAVAVLLSQWLTRGLRRLSDATRRLEAGEYGVRVAPAGGGEEMEQLATAFNSMATRVAASHEELEARLREARMLTEELSVANERAEEARAQAESADQAKSEFLATMSHEIRTPINAVLGFCQVLELENLPEATRGEYLQRMQRAARQLAALVDDVLDLSRIQSGAANVRPAPVPVRPAVDAAWGLVSDDAQRKQISFTVDAEGDVVAMADPDRLEQVLLNLLANAVKFTPAGGSIAVRARQVDDDVPPSVAIVVEDSGIGVPPEKLDAIFEPFVQGHTGYTREYGGTGLGLSISRRLARLMNGDLTAEDRPGGGARFTLRLPAAAAVTSGGPG